MPDRSQGSGREREHHGEVERDRPRGGFGEPWRLTQPDSSSVAPASTGPGYGPGASVQGYGEFGGRLRDEESGASGEHRGRGPRGYRRADERIFEDVCERLTEDAWIDASEIEVCVEEGEVYLVGFVTDRSQKRRAEDLADSVSGVRDVINRLRVGSRES